MWTCPTCGAKVDPSFDVCWQDGTARDGTPDATFQTADEEGPIPDPPETSDLGGPEDRGAGAELVPCYQAYSLIEAKFLADMLREQGIPAASDDQDMQDMLGGWSGNPRVYCHEGDLDRARAIFAQYERTKAGHDPLEP